MDDQVHNQPLSDRSLIACRHCDLIQRLPAVDSGSSVRCPRCGEELWRRRDDALNRTLALATAAAVLYVVANSVPMLAIAVVGRQASTTVIGGVQHLWSDGRETVAALVLFTAVLAPALQIGCLLAIALGGLRPRPPRWVGMILRHLPTTQIWSMLEVMMLGVLVALVKIADYARVIPGVALFVLGALVVLLTAMQTTFDPKEVWDKIEWADESAAARDVAVGGAPEGAQS